MIKPARTLLAATAALAIAIPATAETTDEEFVPDLREERTYLLCAGDNKVQNDSGPVAWDTTPPAASYQSGAGCGYADTGPSDPDTEPILGEDPTGEIVLEGTYKGNLETLSVHLHSIDSHWTRSELFPLGVTASVEIDGNTVLDTEGNAIDMTPVRSESGLTAFVEFSLTHIGLVSEADLTEHEVVVRINSYYSDDINGWVWGASEIDSGLTFNPATLAPVRVRATS